jgi:hypothetical protein
MIPFLIISVIVLYLFQDHTPATLTTSNTPNNTPNNSIVKKSYKLLVEDLIKHHGMSLYYWNNNIRINKNKDGFGIGDGDVFLYIVDDKPLKIYLNKTKINLETYDTNKAIEKIFELSNSANYSNKEKHQLIVLLNLLMKFKEYYYFTKYYSIKNNNIHKIRVNAMN